MKFFAIKHPISERMEWLPKCVVGSFMNIVYQYQYQNSRTLPAIRVHNNLCGVSVTELDLLMAAVMGGARVRDNIMTLIHH